MPVRLFQPEDDGRGWVCRYEIEWPDGLSSGFAAGIDAVQALILALQMIGIQLYTSKYHQARNLRWNDRDGGYGFPVARNVRDLLIGGDVNL